MCLIAVRGKPFNYWVYFHHAVFAINIILKTKENVCLSKTLVLFFYNLKRFLVLDKNLNSISLLIKEKFCTRTRHLNKSTYLYKYFLVLLINKNFLNYTYYHYWLPDQQFQFKVIEKSWSEKSGTKNSLTCPFVYLFIPYRIDHVFAFYAALVVTLF